MGVSVGHCTKCISDDKMNSFDKRVCSMILDGGSSGYNSV